MSQKRMFSNAVIDNDKFVDMPLSTQALYFHLGMKADDDGFVGSPRRIVRAVNCTEDDLKLLVAKGFILCFDSGVIVITHWNENNSIRKERKKDTLFQAEKQQLIIENKNVYTLCSTHDTQMSPTCHPNGAQMSAQDRIDKYRLGKDRVVSLSTDVDAQPRFDYQSVINLFNSVCASLPKVQKLTDKRRKAVNNAQRLLGETSFEELFARIERSDFLTGRTGRWSCGFDWVLQPANLTKILEGNYDNKAAPTPAPRNYDEEF